MEPSEQIEMRSMIEDAYPDEDFSLPIFAVPTVVPGRTFLEKVFLLKSLTVPMAVRISNVSHDTCMTL